MFQEKDNCPTKGVYRPWRTQSYYEEQILKEIKALPEEALPKVLRLITLVREEFFAQERQEPQKASRETSSHEKTQQLLAASKSNWAQELIAEREDRL